MRSTLRSKMRFVTELGLACTLALTAASLASAAPGQILSQTRSTAPRTTVLPLSEGPQMIGTGADRYWMPRPTELRHLEADLPRSLAGYYRQYLGIIQGGRRLIFINGFSASVAPEFIGGKYDWHRHAVEVMDGGRDFFQATYDPHTRQFTGPHFNGLG